MKSVIYKTLRKSGILAMLWIALALLLAYSNALLAVHLTPLYTVPEKMVECIIGLMLLGLPAASAELCGHTVSRRLLKIAGCYLLAVALYTVYMEWHEMHTRGEGYLRLVAGFSLWLTLTSPCALLVGVVYGALKAIDTRWVIAYVLLAGAASAYARIGFPVMFFALGCLLGWLLRAAIGKPLGDIPQF